MNKFFVNRSLSVLALFSLTLATTDILGQKSNHNLVDFVDPFIGSGGHGHVFVGASVPFGAVQIGPNNIYKGWDWCSGYHYSDSLLIGFSQLHLSGTGIGDLADVLIMPYTGEVKLSRGRQEYPHNGYLSTFSHKNEVVRPGFYSVVMDNGVKVELSASERVGYHRYYFPKEKTGRIMVDLKEGINDQAKETSLEQIDDYTLIGKRVSSGWAKNQQVFFAIKSSVPVKDLKIYRNDSLISNKSAKGPSLKGLISFEKAPGLVELKVGISPVSEKNALDNIQKEIPGWDFSKIVNSAQEKWEKELSKVTVETNNLSEKRIFYTSLYHSMVHPSLFNDCNGDYMGADGKPCKASSFTNYSVFSTWDTYRAEHPLFTLLFPNRTNDFVNSMLSIYDRQGYLPVWHLNANETGTMVGISSQQIVAEAYLKGLHGFDQEKAYAAIRATAMSDMRGLDFIKKFQPVPSDGQVGRPVAQALELAISDASIALMAKKLGKAEDFEYFKKRSRNYKLYFDPKTEFFRGVMTDGTWNPVFDPIKSTKPWAKDYAEGNSWQYLWLVPQDLYGLMSLLGGEKAFVNKLDTFFSLKSEPDAGVLEDLTGTIGQYAHGNEPSHHIAYLYAYAGEQWKTAEKIRFILKNFYTDKMDGIIGNEDCGQMSAWYIFSSLGFYPVLPASENYVIGSPLFDKVTLNLQNSKKFIVEAINNNESNIYIQRVELNGRPYTKSFITHQDLINGGSMKIFMDSKPSAFGTLQKDRPVEW